MKIKTLIIDDDEISIMLTDILLKEIPFFQEINSYLDGNFALENLKMEYSNEIAYIIILDINMPLMSGWEFLEEIKHFASHKNTSVFMLSSSTDKLDMEKAEKFELVKGFFSKPLKNENLKEMQALTTN
ncbi:response regulator [Marivirga sp.]|uniref:response regulator n=1 Tax=Marivirga sp. TaxID=2018662 RepID=UPI002D7F6387|nr:response regulator [Marivirga sp.]HET8861075.1 response regulator [Marivirga sp.]